MINNTLLLISQRKFTNRRDNKVLIEELNKKFQFIINISFDNYFIKGPYGKAFENVDYMECKNINELVNIVSKYNKKNIALLNTISENHIGQSINKIFDCTSSYNFISNENIWASLIPSDKKGYKNKFLHTLQNPVGYFYGIKQRFFKNKILKYFKIKNIKSKNIQTIVLKQNDYLNTDFIPSKEYFIKNLSKKEALKNLDIIEDNYCTYIDQNFLFHPDYNSMANKKNIDNFYISLTPLFQHINSLGYKILFTPHPSMSKDEYTVIQTQLKDIEIVFLDFGSTMSAIKVSKINIGHYSLAHFYAMFERQATLLVKTQELYQIFEDNNVDVVADILQVNIFDMTKNDLTDLTLEKLKIPREDFCHFDIDNVKNQYEYLVARLDK